MSRKPLVIVGIVWILLTLACTRSAHSSQSWRASSPGKEAVVVQTATPTPGAPKRGPNDPILTPTPDAPHILPTLATDPQQYTVQPSDTLGEIAKRFGISLESLIEENKLDDPDHLEVGQVIHIPTPDPQALGPGFKIIPDSELVFGPSSAYFDLAAFIQQCKGYLSRYQEDLDNRTYDGASIVDRVARENSVNPRLLLAVLEYRSQWVTQATPPDGTTDFPMRLADNRRKGLYRQLSWAANHLDYGFYIWRASGRASWVLQDGSVIPVNPIINAGTAGVQSFFSQVFGRDDWLAAVGENGLFATYVKLFGYPFDLAVEPLIPSDLKQPPMQLPFEPGVDWAFTGGPHGGWANGSGWAAIDFAPAETRGCVQSDAWETAVADGLIIRSDLGAVVEDLDGDGLEQTGWTVLYMHVETRDRVQAGTTVHAGDRIGHPSCEGGLSNGSHLHLARRYNGEWIPADGPIPFNLDGWISKGDGIEYNGFLVKDGTTVEAMEGRHPENQISR
jgi:murein DD-endopeptidase MepM/ murein hydrolase activator NlpD